MEMNKDELSELIKSSISSAMDEKLGSFFIEREQHYQDHMFVKNVREFSSKVSTTACNVVTKAGMIGMIALFGYGVFDWLRKMVAETIKKIGG